MCVYDTEEDMRLEQQSLVSPHLQNCCDDHFRGLYCLRLRGESSERDANRSDAEDCLDSYRDEDFRRSEDIAIELVRGWQRVTGRAS